MKYSINLYFSHLFSKIPPKVVSQHCRPFGAKHNSQLISFRVPTGEETLIGTELT